MQIHEIKFLENFIINTLVCSDMCLNDCRTTIDDLKKMVGDFCTERDWDQFHTNKEVAIGIVTEASELLELMRFKNDSQIENMMHSDRRQDIVDELCDTLYFVLRFAQINGIDLSTGLEAKLKQNSEKYPVELCKGKNLKYDEY